ncbi:RNA polymerase sigma factor [Streptosporangium sp. G11]|uniref:RNA polymerase sigma factor n=1 Tax=Streptosporangium sp. G11 TaxID=3436926 RepID=UPI003EC0D6B8
MESFTDGTLPSDDVVVAALRAGDEAMFTALLDTWSRGMLWLARAHVSTNDSAEEVVQDTWLAVIRGIEGFEGRSSVKTWVYRILVNTARRRGVRENRTVPWSSVFEQERQTVDRSCFQGVDDPFPGCWKDFPTAWPTPESEVLAAEVRDRIAAALAELPLRQRTVITLRDVEGCTSEEVCEILEISAANQRVLLHRARTAVRGRLEDYFETARRPT